MSLAGNGHRAQHAVAALMLLLLGACAAPPRPAPTPVPLAPGDLGLGSVASAPAPPQWWRSLQDAQLDNLIIQALADNPDLAQAGARLRLAQAQLEGARAARLPEAKFDAGETRLKIPAGFPPALDSGHSVWAGDLGASLKWDLDLWGRQADAVARARAQAQAAALDIENAKLLLSAAVVQAYVDLYRGYELADIATRAAAQRNDILALTRRRVAAGIDTRVELREAEGALPQAQVALLQAQSAQLLARHELAALAGQGAGTGNSLERPQLQLEAALPLPLQLPLNLLARRPDVIAARLRIEAADADRRAAKAAFYPHVDLSALLGYASFSLSDLIGASAFGYGAGPALSLPLFDGGRLHSQYHGAEAQLQSAVADYDATVLQAVHQAADQLSLIDTLNAQLVQQRDSLAAAEDAYRLAQERYGAGLAGYLTVLNAESAVLDQRRQRLDLASALVMARVRLLLAVGGSFEAPPDLSRIAASSTVP
jgi:NodT family efflux transporter outer membrane factor (OMF) lipoprotein